MVTLEVKTSGTGSQLEVSVLGQDSATLLRLLVTSNQGKRSETLRLSSQQPLLLKLFAPSSNHNGNYVLTLKGPVFPPSASLASNTSPPPIDSTPPSRPTSSSRETIPPKIEMFSPEIKRGQIVRLKGCNVTLRGRVTDDSQISEVEVNGAPVSLDQKNEFSTNLALQSGNHRVIVTATDAHGNKAREEFSMACDSASPPVVAGNSSPSNPLATTLAAAKQYALVIGINNYQNLPKLQTAVNDAKEVAQVLEKQFGFEVELLLDTGRTEISTALNKYPRLLDGNSSLLIYYAGHGQYDKQVEKAYWLPADASKNDDVNWIIADDITAKLKRIPAQHVLIVSDSCYSGTLSRDSNLDLTTPAERKKYLLKANTSKSRVLIASGGNEPVADSGGGQHSVFAAALLRGLRELKQKEFTAEELFYSYILQQVTGKSDQKPEYSHIRNSGHDGGDFIFVRR